MRRFVHRWQMNILKQKLNHHRGTIKQCPQYWRYHNNWARIYTCTCSPEYLYTKLEIEQVIVTALDSSTLRRRRCYSAPLHGRNPLCFPTCLQIFHKVCRVFALQIQPGDSTKQTQKQIAGRATDHQLSSTSSLSLVSKSGWRYAKRVPSQVSAAFFFFISKLVRTGFTLLTVKDGTCWPWLLTRLWLPSLVETTQPFGSQ